MCWVPEVPGLQLDVPRIGTLELEVDLVRAHGTGDSLDADVPATVPTHSQVHAA